MMIRNVILPPPAAAGFIVSGHAPAGSYGNKPTADYGFDRAIHETGPAQINGTLTVTVPFDPPARSCMLHVRPTATASRVTCTIAGDGSGGPRTVSAGEFASCNLQATRQNHRNHPGRRRPRGSSFGARGRSGGRPARRCCWRYGMLAAGPGA